MQEPFRVPPKGGPQDYKTYAISSPVATHTRPATCEEVDCANYRNGWRVRVEGLDPRDVHAAKNSGRAFVELSVTEGETWLVFEAGQPCFAATTHRAPLDRPATFLVRDGDWRGNPFGTKPYMHTRPDLWVEDFAEYQEKVAKLLEGRD